MTIEDINRMAQKAGFPERRAFSDLSDLYLRLERFASLVRADERNRTWTQEHWTEYEHSIVAGALFDFMGWLTSRKERIVLSSADNASPAVEAITEFAKMRGLSLDDAKVQDWQDSLRSNT